MGANIPNGIGASPRRKEDQRFLTGAGNYTDDINIQGQTYAYFLRSPPRPVSSPSSRAPISPRPRSAACPAAG
jgi:hypothetical protein